MDNVIVRSFNLKAIEILHAELSKLIKQDQLLIGNSGEIFRLSLWGENYLGDLDQFLGSDSTQKFASVKSRLEWANVLNPLFRMFQNKTHVYFGEELFSYGKELPLLSI